MLDKLEMFVALARERHFGRAAEAFGVSQPSLSAGIRQLEDMLGVQLVRRGSRYQGLTPEGERMLIWALRIVADSKAMRAEMLAARKGLTGRLRIGVIPTAESMLTALTAPLLRRHAALEVTALSASADEIARRIETLELDAGITYLRDLPDRLERLPLYEERLSLLLPERHPLAEQASVDWADLVHAPLCLLSSDMRNRATVNARLAEAGRATPPQIEANSILTIVAHVRSGGWLSVLPEPLQDFFKDLPGLRRAILPGDGEPVVLAFSARAPRPPAVEALIKEAKALAR